MRLHIEGKDTPIAPHLVGRIAERLEQLNSPHEDIWEVRVTLVQQADGHEAQVRLLLSGTTLMAQHHGASPDAAIGAALRSIADALTVHRRRRQYARAVPRLPLLPEHPPSRATRKQAKRVALEGTAEQYHGTNPVQ